VAIPSHGHRHPHPSERKVTNPKIPGRRTSKLYTGSRPGQDDDRIIDPATEPARVRAMFVRADWTRRGLGRAILVSCRRAAVAEGFGSLALLATLPGVPLYRSFGFRETERLMILMPDGVEIEGVVMTRGVEQLYGSVSRCAATELANEYPLEASQLIDQVIAPRIDGYATAGVKPEQFVRRARQLSAALTLDGDW
jgi:hypothetical protein